eukprot:TRINITY_DN44889_c0_g2_i1.p1 TRINITY_DN44889_c0_g2~~TRINITY_DN44889_c0_g2_i1.p1  ORF type:complete len:581 (+),score=107.71 TRINITY_DN44889_c0_g2_i1:109-1851(+)
MALLSPRCGIFLLGFTVFTFYYLLFDELLTLDENVKVQSPGTAADLQAVQEGDDVGLGRLHPMTELYKGTYVLQLNGASVYAGTARVSIGSSDTADSSIQMSSVVVTLQGGVMDEEVRAKAVAAGADFADLSALQLAHGLGPFKDSSLFRTRKQEVSMFFKGLDFGSVGRMTASGMLPKPTESLGFSISPPDGATACKLDAVLNTPAKATRDDTEQSDSQSQGSLLRGSMPTVTPEPDAMPPRLEGDIVSADCGFRLGFIVEGLNLQRIGYKVMSYSIWSNTITAIQIRCFVLQIKHTEDGTSAGRLSMVGIALQALIDGYDSFLHLSLSAQSSHVFNTFAVVSLFKFFLFSLLEVRYLLMIWRVRHRDVFAEGWEAVRRELARVYSRFYGAFIAGLVIMANFLSWLEIFVFILQAYWLPQIILDLKKGTKNTFHPVFVAGMSITRCFGLLYLWGCPHGVFNGDVFPEIPGAPDPWFCVAVVLFQALQVGTMASQRILGPRWFVPWICLPNVYNYRRAAEVPVGTECVICMGDVLPHAVGEQQRVTTPCNHRFHRGCLERWLDVKMECPTCRADLPPFSG